MLLYLLFSFLPLVMGQLTVTDMETIPFTLPDGSEYRDMLTIVASKAVAEFADRFQPNKRHEIERNKALNRGPPQSPQFFSHRLDQPTGTNALDSLEFVDSRHVDTPADYKSERAKANSDEERIITYERPQPNIALAIEIDGRASPVVQRAINRQRQGGGGRFASSARPSPVPYSEPAGNYQTVRTHGLSYSTGSRPYDAYDTYDSFNSGNVVAELTGFSALQGHLPKVLEHQPAGALAGLTPAATKPLDYSPTPFDYTFEVNHGSPGSSSYFTIS